MHLQDFKMFHVENETKLFYEKKKEKRELIVRSVGFY